MLWNIEFWQNAELDRIISNHMIKAASRITESGSPADQPYIRPLAPEWSEKALWLYWLVLHTGIIRCPAGK